MKSSEEEGQKKIDEWYKKLPEEIDRFYLKLSKKIKAFQTFDLLSNISFYNHLHESQTYTDNRGDKHFFISEVIALLCLKFPFVKKSILNQKKFGEEIFKIQDIASNYCGRKSAYEGHSNHHDNNTLSIISDSLKRESLNIRNLGLPDHHLIFSKELFNPIENELNTLLGFTISDSIKIRESISKLLNKKINDAISDVKKKTKEYYSEVIKYRINKEYKEDSVFTLNQLNEYILLPDKEIENGLENNLLNKLFYNLSDIYTFSDLELSKFSKISLDKVKSFLKLFSCSFPSLQEHDEIYSSTSILKTNPILFNDGKYLIPSLPLLIWAVEDVVEANIKKQPKLNKRYPNIRHDFLLEKGISYFSKILPTATIHPPNLFYTENENRYETDGLIVYDKVLFIIEAKGNRITTKAKKGHQLKLKDHIEDIVKDSYKQGIRTLKHIEEKGNAQFKTKNGSIIEINKNDFDDIIIVSLVLEPIGHLSMSIKATNGIGYFNEGHFPWIISLYDLIIIADLFDNPFLLILYLKRRKQFLNKKALSIYEELDLVGHFLKNGLFIEDSINQIEKEQIDIMQFMPETDYINDYYMYHFGKKEQFTPKPKSYISRECNEFLIHFDKSKLENRVKMALILLDFNNKSIQDFMIWIKKNKKMFSKDKSLHDCSIYTQDKSGIGITYMVANEKKLLDYKLYNYCQYKQSQLKTNIWIGFGDISKDKRKYNFKSMFIAIRNKPTE